MVQCICTEAFGSGQLGGGGGCGDHTCAFLGQILGGLYKSDNRSFRENTNVSQDLGTTNISEGCFLDCAAYERQHAPLPPNTWALAPERQRCSGHECVPWFLGVSPSLDLSSDASSSFIPKETHPFEQVSSTTRPPDSTTRSLSSHHRPLHQPYPIVVQGSAFRASHNMSSRYAQTMKVAVQDRC